MTGFRRDAQDSAVLGSSRLAQVIREAEVELPAYVYDVDGMTETLRSLRHAFGDAPHLVAYAIKANSAAGTAPARMTTLSTLATPRKMYSPNPPAR